MTVLKFAAATAILTAPLMFAGASAEAATAKQYAFEGQGTFLTSKGIPTNFAAGDAPQSQAYLAERARVSANNSEHREPILGGR